MSHDQPGCTPNLADMSHQKVMPQLSDALGQETAPVSALRICQDVQHMIDINFEHLERLRTPMTLTSGNLSTIFYE